MDMRMGGMGNGSFHRLMRDNRSMLHLFFQDQLGNIARFGDSREIDLGLDLVGIFAPNPRFSSARAPAVVDILAHTLGFIQLQGTGVRLLFRNSDFRQDVEDRLALNL